MSVLTTKKALRLEALRLACADLTPSGGQWNPAQVTVRAKAYVDFLLSGSVAAGPANG